MSFRRNKKNTNHCPTCGIFVCPGYQAILADKGKEGLPLEARGHACDPEFLKRSARMRNAMLSHDPDDDEPRERSLGTRLDEGYLMLREDDNDLD
jgi:hypothetical protein